MKLLAIESSCDETSASILHDGAVKSTLIKSQIGIHEMYGGVIPELAAANHLQVIRAITTEALDKAHDQLSDIDVFAATSRPGLPGSLLIGLSYAKALAITQGKPLIAVDHLAGHIYSACIEHTIPYPFLCLTVSGGHTALYIVKSPIEYERIGHTVDDAAGEAFDKVAKLLHLPYPGGPVIEKLAGTVDFKDYFNYPRGKSDTLQFSFSGIKTAVMYHLVQLGAYDMTTKKWLHKDNDPLKAEVSSSLLCAVRDILITKLKRALKEHKEIKAIAFVGGVACNKFLRQELKSAMQPYGIEVYSPSPLYCTDNAAMIGYVAYQRALLGQFSPYNVDVL